MASFDATALLQSEMDYWDGFGVQTEWFVSRSGTAALAVFGDADNMQILAIDIDENGTAHTQSTDRVEFSTGGPEF